MAKSGKGSTSLLGTGNYSSKASRLEAICDHFLDLGLGLREQSGLTAIWPCLGCEWASFVARLAKRAQTSATEGARVLGAEAFLRKAGGN